MGREHFALGRHIPRQTETGIGDRAFQSCTPRVHPDPRGIFFTEKLPSTSKPQPPSSLTRETQALWRGGARGGGTGGFSEF
jgi:hypothetical protein